MAYGVDLAFSALADRSRRRVIELLVDGPRRTNELADAIGVSVPAVSRYLRVLCERSLVERLDVEGDGRGRRYQINPDRLADVELVFPGSATRWDRASTLASVVGHAPDVAWDISESSVRALGAGLTLVVITGAVQTTINDAAVSVAALEFYARAFDSEATDQMYDGDRLVNGHVLIGSSLVGVAQGGWARQPVAGDHRGFAGPPQPDRHRCR